MSLKNVVACIRKNKRFLITSHTSLEGDALGSELSFYRLLRKLGKSAIIVNSDALPYGYDFLPGVTKIKKFKPNLKNLRFDCLVVLDCSDLRRTGGVYKLNFPGKPILNIDHHISNEEFGDVNWIEPGASSCSEIIYKLYRAMRIPFDKDTALLLYVGILTDTGSFRYSNTKASTHKAVAELMKYKFNVPEIYKSIYENIPFLDIKLLGRILSGMRSGIKGKVAWIQLKHKPLKDKKFTFDLSEYILNFCRAMKDVEVALLFKPNLRARDEVRVNFRSQGKVDVNKIARFFGGGGHKTASGATVKGKIEEVRRRVLAKIKESLI